MQGEKWMDEFFALVDKAETSQRAVAVYHTTVPDFTFIMMRAGMSPRIALTTIELAYVGSLVGHEVE